MTISSSRNTMGGKCEPSKVEVGTTASSPSRDWIAMCQVENPASVAVSTFAHVRTRVGQTIVTNTRPEGPSGGRQADRVQLPD